MQPRRLTLALLSVLTLGAAGCGDNLKDSGIPDGSQTGAAAPVATTPSKPEVDAAQAFAAGNAVEPVGNAQDLAKKPQIPKPKGKPGAALVVKDLVVGKGPVAKSGDALSVRYVGVSYSTGKEFDASWKTTANLFPFTLGQGMVIKGWDKGIVGMKVGGRRELVIPPALGYANAGSGKLIKPGETLVFVVDLKKIG